MNEDSEILSHEHKNILEHELNIFDQNINCELEGALEEIRLKSKALASSLKRCFEDARKSERFEAAFKSGFNEIHALQSPNKINQEISREILGEVLSEINNKYEEKDFMIFREFVRLLRACSLHIGGHVSGKIKDCYNKTLKEERLLIAYNLGKQLSKK